MKRNTSAGINTEEKRWKKNSERPSVFRPGGIFPRDFVFVQQQIAFAPADTCIIYNGRVPGNSARFSHYKLLYMQKRTDTLYVSSTSRRSLRAVIIAA